MHAYLISGLDEGKINEKIKYLLHQKNATPIPFVLLKIQDVRDLSKQVSLKLPQMTAYIIKNIDNATPGALNAFLKVLEEPQSNLIFILTVTNVYKVIPTILSRCQLITIEKELGSFAPNDFDSKSIGQKFTSIDTIRERSDAIRFINDLIYFYHQQLLTSNNPKHFAKLLEEAQKTYSALKANGNVQLQLTSFIVATARI